jgi:hypothetical protein
LSSLEGDKKKQIEQSNIKIKEDQRKITEYLQNRELEDKFKSEHPIVLYSGRHPLVGDNIIARIETDERPDDQLTSNEKIEKYFAYAFIFYWSA